MKTYLAALLLFGLHSAALAEMPKEQFVRTIFGGKGNFHIVMNAAKVNVCLLKEQHLFKRPSVYKEGEQIAVPAERLRELRQILSSTATYVTTSRVCMPTYGVRFIFYSPEGRVNIDLCFHCSILNVMSRRNGGISSGCGFFDPAHEKLLALCIALFPGDKELKNIEKR